MGKKYDKSGNGQSTTGFQATQITASGDDGRASRGKERPTLVLVSDVFPELVPEVFLEPMPDEVITICAMARMDSKRSGEASEAEFVARACRLHFRVARPWGDSEPYDALVRNGQAFWRVQVKCTHSHYRREGRYVINATGRRSLYTKDDIDFIAAHIVPLNIWYIVPIEAFEGQSRLHFCPNGTGKARYERYREAWCLLACAEKARGWKDIPVLCRCRELEGKCAVCPLGTASI